MADSYWTRRRRRADEAMSRRERDVHRRVKRYYADEMKALGREIAALYERHGGEEGVLRYRDMMQRMDEEDLRLLMRDCEEFARQHPEQAGLVAFRKDAYLLDRLEGLQQSVRLHMAKATAEAVDGLDDHFAHVAADAANAVAETMGYGSSFHTYDDDAVRQFVGRPWSDGESFSDRIWDNAAKLAEYVNGDMAKAIARGDSWRKLCDEIASRFEGQSASNIMRVVQTEGTYVARQAQGAELRREGFDEYFIDPLGDSRTCEVCRSMGRRSHGEPFRFDEAEVGVNYPPLHPRCRCEVNPAVEDWDEWLRRRREERRQAGVSDETVARRFGARLASGDKLEWPPRRKQISRKEFLKLREFAESKNIELEGFRHCDSDPAACRVMIESAAHARDALGMEGKIKLRNAMLLDDDFASTDLESRTITVNSSALRNLGALKKNHRKLMDEHWFVEADSPEAVMYHEMGHLFAFENEIDILERAKKALSADDIQKLMDIIKNKVSDYAAAYIDGTEIPSEVAAAYLSGSSNETIDAIAREFGMVRRHDVGK